VNDDPGIASLAMRTVEDAKRWGRAEVAYYKALAGERGADAGVAAGLAFAAWTIGQAALVALLVGLVLTIAPATGAGVATLIVVAVALVIAAILGFVALGRFRRAMRGGDPS
jgi:uncharacterized membrane protein